MAIRIDRIQQKTGKYIAKTAEESNLGKTLSRELQMVPKYLECAKAKAGDLYRFNTKQVEEISSACNSYETKLSITDVVKELLAIGSKEGNCKQLSSDEMIGFFNATSGMKIHEQKNVLRFLKAAQEDIPERITLEYLRKEHPYEWYKNTTIKMEMRDPETLKRYPDLISEENIKSRYEKFIMSEYRVETNPSYSAHLMPKKFPFVNYIKENNRQMVLNIAQCHDPEALYNVYKIAGVNPETIQASSDLVSLYTMSKGNRYLVKDIARAFFADEIKAITAVLKRDLPKNQKMMENYYQFCPGVNPSLDYSRPAVIYLLDVKESIKLHSLKSKVSEDVYPDNRFGNVRGKKLTGGSYERGKKK